MPSEKVERSILVYLALYLFEDLKVQQRNLALLLLRHRNLKYGPNVNETADTLQKLTVILQIVSKKGPCSHGDTTEM